ncbi:MAG: J domain-containing protein [Spirochaetales bacterium]|nr:J domain-containing protein [Spirochaetales bacterium]
MKDYYAVLGLKQECSKAEIRKAFRNLAKKMHPDVSTEAARADNRFVLLKEAYEILMNSETRYQYDLSRKSPVGEDKFSYREFLKKRSDDARSMAELICYDLLHDNDAEAVELYENLTRSGIFDFRMHMDREAFMDYSFLLAEEYLRQGCYVRAYQIFFNIALLEEDEPYFRHFYDEVLNHLFVICRNPIPEDDNDLLRLRFLHDIAALGYTDRDRARIYRLISQIYSKRRELESAGNYLFRAYEAFPGLEGLEEAVRNIRQYF